MLQSRSNFPENRTHNAVQLVIERIVRDVEEDHTATRSALPVTPNAETVESKDTGQRNVEANLIVGSQNRHRDVKQTFAMNTMIRMQV